MVDLHRTTHPQPRRSIGRNKLYKDQGTPSGRAWAAWSGLGLLPAFGPAAPPRPPPKTTREASPRRELGPPRGAATVSPRRASQGPSASHGRQQGDGHADNRGLRPHPALPPQQRRREREPAESAAAARSSEGLRRVLAGDKANSMPWSAARTRQRAKPARSTTALLPKPRRVVELQQPTPVHQDPLTATMTATQPNRRARQVELEAEWPRLDRNLKSPSRIGPMSLRSIPAASR